MATISEDSIIQMAKDLAPLDSGIGIGDDCACLPLDNDKYQLVTTDSLVEDIHFTQNQSPYDLGFKSLAVNLSDIAAMGGTAQYVLLNLSLPRSAKAEWIKDFFSGFQSLAKQHNVRLIGGDTTGSPGPIAIGVTVIGTVAKDQVKLRSHAQVGDVIAVTNTLGNARAGLECVKQNIEEPILKESFHRPLPMLEAGKILASYPEVHAMMDLSDGLASDLPKLTQASEVGARIDLDEIPTNSSLNHWAIQQGVDAKAYAAVGGEDYQLLCTIKPQMFLEISEKLKQKNINLAAIGDVIEQAHITFEREGKHVPLNDLAFSHF